MSPTNTRDCSTNNRHKFAELNREMCETAAKNIIHVGKQISLPRILPSIQEATIDGRRQIEALLRSQIFNAIDILEVVMAGNGLKLGLPNVLRSRRAGKLL